MGTLWKYVIYTKKMAKIPTTNFLLFKNEALRQMIKKDKEKKSKYIFYFHFISIKINLFFKEVKFALFSSVLLVNIFFRTFKNG